MKKFSLAIAAAALASVMTVPAASADAYDVIVAGMIADIRKDPCSKYDADNYKQQGFKTRNDVYEYYLQFLSINAFFNLSDAQARKVAGAYADKAVSCKAVSYPVSERVTAFFSSKGSGSSIGSFSS